MNSKSDNFISYYDQFKNKIFVYFLYRVNFNREVAEDLTSEVFLKALKSFEDFDQSRSFQSWIYAIAHNHLVNYYRVANRETQLLEDRYLTKGDIDKVELEYELEAIMKIIKLMDSSDREILLMRFVDQLSNTEIAMLLDKDEGAIRTKISRSLAKLRELLDK
ncbi:MAG: RNA polymerase sigma factor [Patescibacteria group bacterium]|jgi:RNA polymerase sigma-70 factor (ECF subfamily)